MLHLKEYKKMNLRQLVKFSFSSLFLLALFFKTAIAQDETSTKIYFGGDIITMNGDTPQYIEAMVQQDGKIAFTGTKEAAVEKYASNATMHDLNGQTLLPGFIDGHGHFYNVGLASLLANILPPPDGNGADFNSIVSTMNDWKETANGKLIYNKFGWLLGNGYDDSQLTEKEHPTAEVLDKISKDIPIAIIHQSGHLAVVNTKALQMLGITKDTADPKGGHIRHNENGDPNGVLEEAAFFNVLMPILAKSDLELQSFAIKDGLKQYSQNGYTTAQDGRTTSDGTQALAKAAKDQKLTIDVVSYPDIIWNVAALETEFYNHEQRYNNHYRIGGVKLTLDGSPQGKTAWLSHPYHVPPTGKDKDYVGFPIMSTEEATKHVTTAFKNKWQILSHTNGDAAIDQFITAITEAKKVHPFDDHRSVLIHGQTLRKDQIPELKNLGIYPSLFPMHTFYWGDWHYNSVLGPERAEYISPTRDVVDAGMTITSHHDAPVTFPKSMRVLDATVNRTTRSGRVLGKDQRLTPYEGLKTLTEWAAIQHFEESKKGTLSVGKLADIVILNKNPLKIDPQNIHSVQIVETIKEGKTVYKQ